MKRNERIAPVAYVTIARFVIMFYREIDAVVRGGQDAKSCDAISGRGGVAGGMIRISR